MMMIFFLELSNEIMRSIYSHWSRFWLATEASDTGDKEWYFFCKRGRKYRNSIRPNRVTGSGFWKATGIDKPVYSHGGEGHRCIGLKKTLVYYRGCAGKGTKTDWMMHEFRLPVDSPSPNSSIVDKSTPQEAVSIDVIWPESRSSRLNQSFKHAQALSSQRVRFDILFPFGQLQNKASVIKTCLQNTKWCDKLLLGVE